MKNTFTNVINIQKISKPFLDFTAEQIFGRLSIYIHVTVKKQLTLCWKKDGSRYLSNRSSNFTSDFFHFTYD